MMRFTLCQLFIVVLLAQIAQVFTITCEIGYGQRGKRYSNQMSWTRTCPGILYCFEAVTTDIKKMRNLIDYPWDEYYDQYYVKSCGGDLGTPIDYHPWRGKPLYYRRVLGYVKVNITTPRVITGYGGTEQLDLKYTCRHDLCSSSSRRIGGMSLIMAIISATIVGVLFL